MPANTNRVERQWVKILTVDPASRRVEGILKDYATIQISVNEVPAAFRWPKEGEWWLIVRENYDWFLRAPRQQSEIDNPIEDLDPGDTQLGLAGAKVRILGDVEIVGDVTANKFHGELDLSDVNGASDLISGEIPIWNGAGWDSASAGNLPSPPFETTIFGDGTTTQFVITHNRGTRRVSPVVYDISTNEFVNPRIVATTTSTLTLEFLPAPAGGVQHAVTVFGGQNAINPAAHASSHAPSGSDPIRPLPQRYEFPNGTSTLDVTVDGNASDLIIISFEYLTSGLIEVMIRPNANAASIVNGWDLVHYHAAPSSTATRDAPLLLTRSGLLISNSIGAGGKLVAAGRITIQTSLHGTRRVARCDTVLSNTVGSGDHYTSTVTSSAVFDDATYGAITSFRFATSSGNFETGTCIVEEIGR